MCSGPTYETPCEAKFYERLGAGALGMSTVPEIMTATALGLNVIGISMITNLASFLSPKELTDDDVREVSKIAKPHMCTLLLKVMEMVQIDESKRAKILSRFSPDQPVPPVLPLTKVSAFLSKIV